MKLIFIGAGPDNPDFLTVKAKAILERYRTIIYAGSLVNPEVMAIVPHDAERHDSAGMNLEETTAVCEKAMADGIDLVNLHPEIIPSMAQPESR
jgi:precorrin-4/cobalt-precorrin-4 C11-methyltransferase